MLQVMIKPKYILEFYATIFIPLIYFVILYLASIGNTINTPIIFRGFGLLLIPIGLGFWFLSYLQLGSSFGVLPRSRNRVTHGLYSRYHHPMYIGIILTFFGVSLANQSLAGIAATILLLLPLLLIRAKLEEHQLQK
jgi:protein-S-isoprenylcysteine O-methyltransferase Ste14